MKPTLIALSLVAIFATAGCFENLFTTATPIASPSPGLTASPGASPSPGSENIVAGDMLSHVRGSGQGDDQTQFHLSNLVDLTYVWLCRSSDGSIAACQAQPLTVLWDVFPPEICFFQGAQRVRNNTLKCDDGARVLVTATAVTPDGFTVDAQWQGQAIN